MGDDTWLEELIVLTKAQWRWTKVHSAITMHSAVSTGGVRRNGEMYNLKEDKKEEDNFHLKKLRAIFIK
jgi:hypothetical protein